jgi:hypothetical protein
MDADATTRARPLWLTREEAGHLLALAIASQANLGEAEERVLLKLGQVVRAFLRDEEPSEPSCEVCATTDRVVTRDTSAAARRRRIRRLTPRSLLPTRAT